jgi:hypothetical protein
VSLAHAGVFGARDADLREDVLEFVTDQLRRVGTWLATLGEIADWWRRREGLRLEIDGDRVRATNHGSERLEGVRVVFERGAGTELFAVPPLEPGETHRIHCRADTPQETLTTQWTNTLPYSNDVTGHG